MVLKYNPSEAFEPFKMSARQALGFMINVTTEKQRRITRHLQDIGEPDPDEKIAPLPDLKPDKS